MKAKIAAVSVIAAAAVAFACVGTASAGVPQLVGVFCSNPNAMPKPGACIQLSYRNQTAQGYTGSPDRVLTVRPGFYFLSVDDNATAHNYELEAPFGFDWVLTGVEATPGWRTFPVLLTPGTWVLFCQPHRAMGMYVDINVGWGRFGG
jgi:hypothetical protein